MEQIARFKHLLRGNRCAGEGRVEISWSRQKDLM